MRSTMRFMSIDGFAPGKVESRGDVSDDENQAGKVTSRARLRIAELLQKPFDVRSIALTGLFILAVFYTIYFMRSMLLPIVLALLLSYLLRPIVRGLAKLKIPLAVSAAVILIGLLGLVGYGISALATPTVAWLKKAPAGLAELQHKLRPVKKSVAQVTQATSEIEKLATTNAEAKAVEVKRHPITEMFLHADARVYRQRCFFGDSALFPAGLRPGLHCQTGQAAAHALR